MSRPRKTKRRRTKALPPPPLEFLETAAPQTSKPPKSITELGAPPEDPLAAQAYLYKMLVLSAHDTANDENITARERRRELRSITTAAGRLLPRARLWHAEQLVLRHRDEIARKRQHRGGAKLEPRPPGAGGSK